MAIDTVVHTAANVHNSKALEETVDAVWPVRGPRGRPGRPRKRPKKLHGDKAYDFPGCRKALRERGITPRIVRRSVESGEQVGTGGWSSGHCRG